jgi:hypothetical protein
MIHICGPALKFLVYEFTAHGPLSQAVMRI